jgi:hypothetical protein
MGHDDVRASFSAQVETDGGPGPELNDVLDTLITHIESQSYIPITYNLGGGQTWTAGNYVINSAAEMSGLIYLDALGNDQAVFVIRVIGALHFVTGATVVLLDGAQACNVFWLVNGAITTGINCDLIGNLVSKGAVTLVSDCLLEGRILTTSGLITLHNNSGVIELPPDGSSIYTMGLLTPYQLYSATGDITRLGGLDLFVGEVYASLGTISGFGTPYDGVFPSTSLPLVKFSIGIYNGTSLIESSARTVTRNLHGECCALSTVCNISALVHLDISVKIHVITRLTRVKIGARSLEVHSVYN